MGVQNTIRRYVDVAATTLGPGFQSAVALATKSVEKAGYTVANATAILTGTDGESMSFLVELETV